MGRIEVRYYSYRSGRSREIRVRRYSPLGDGVEQAVHNPTLGVHTGGHSPEKQEKVAFDLRALGAPQGLAEGLSRSVNGNDTHAIGWLRSGRAVAGIVEHTQTHSGQFKVIIAKLK